MTKLKLKIVEMQLILLNNGYGWLVLACFDQRHILSIQKWIGFCMKYWKCITKLKSTATLGLFFCGMHTNFDNSIAIDGTWRRNNVKCHVILLHCIGAREKMEERSRYNSFAFECFPSIGTSDKKWTRKKSDIEQFIDYSKSTQVFRFELNGWRGEENPQIYFNGPVRWSMTCNWSCLGDCIVRVAQYCKSPEEIKSMCVLYLDRDVHVERKLFEDISLVAVKHILWIFFKNSDRMQGRSTMQKNRKLFVRIKLNVNRKIFE